MGLFDQIKKALSFNKTSEALQSDNERSAYDLKRSEAAPKALESASKYVTNKQEYLESTNIQPQSTQFEQNPHSQLQQAENKYSPQIELQKESLQLGVAAGYTGRAIKDMEIALARIESQMITKDWFLSNLRYKIPEIMGILDEMKIILEKHEIITTKRFDSIESALNRISVVSEQAPEPIKTAINNEIDSIIQTMPLTSKMKKLISIVHESGQISYDDLGVKLGLTRSALRGLLANAMKRTDEIERFSIDNKGWVRHKSNSQTSPSSIIQTAPALE
jgi:hypothetical protein